MNLTELRKEKEDLLKKLESSSEITSLAEEVSRLPDPRIQVSTFSAKSMDLEIKQLQCKLKVTLSIIKHENILSKNILYKFGHDLLN